MKPFTLQAVLDLRKRREDLAQNRLFEAKQAVKRIETKLLQEQRILTETLNILDSLQKEGIEIGTLIRYEDKIQRLRDNIQAIEKNLQNKKTIVQQVHEMLVACSKEHKIMKRLKEEKNKAWQQYLNKKEVAMLDEIGVMRHDNTVY